MGKKRTVVSKNNTYSRVSQTYLKAKTKVNCITQTVDKLADLLHSGFVLTAIKVVKTI